MTPRKTLLAAAAAAGLLVSVTACGSDDGNGGDNGGPASEERDNNGDDDGDEEEGGDTLDGLSGAEIADLAVDATQSVDSVKMSAEIIDEDDGSSMEMDLDIADVGCTGTVTMDGIGGEFLTVDGATYVKQPPEALEAQGIDPAEAEAIVGDNWIRNDDAELDAMMCDLSVVLEEFTELTESEDGNVEIVDGQDVDGQATVGLILPSDDDITIYVQDDQDAPYILLVQHDSEGFIGFSDFDEDFDIQAPAEDEVVDLADLA